MGGDRLAAAAAILTGARLVRVTARLSLVLALAVAWQVPAAAVASATTAVHPTGVYPDDVALVQAAVDQGGTVLLKASDAVGVPTSFNFGPAEPGSGHVELTRDTRLIGETLPNGQTTIRGGHAPLRSFAAIETVVQGMTFDGPLRFALLFAGPESADTTITDNRVTNVVGQFFSRFGSVAEAMIVFGGATTVTDNTIERIHSDRAIGISQGFSSGPVEVARNRVSDVPGIGIEATKNASTVRITDNVVTPSGAGRFATGIEVNGTGSYYVARNQITVDHPRGVGFIAWGTEAFGFGSVTAPVVERNNIVVYSDWDAIELIGLVSDGYIGQNHISGKVGDTAFWLSGTPANSTNEVSRNTFSGNNIAQLETGLATVFLDEFTHDNVFIGQPGTVIDLGTDNVYTGMTPHRGPGPQLKDALEHRNAQLLDSHAMRSGLDGG